MSCWINLLSTLSLCFMYMLLFGVRFPETEPLVGSILQLDEVSFKYAPNCPDIFSNVDLSATNTSRICIVSTRCTNTPTLSRIIVSTASYQPSLELCMCTSGLSCIWVFHGSPCFLCDVVKLAVSEDNLVPWQHQPSKRLIIEYQRFVLHTIPAITSRTFVVNAVMNFFGRLNYSGGW